VDIKLQYDAIVLGKQNPLPEVYIVNDRDQEPNRIVVYLYIYCFFKPQISHAHN